MKLTPFRSLSFRLSLVVGLVLAAGVALFVTVSIRHQESALVGLKREGVRLLAETVKGSLMDAMGKGAEGREALREVIRHLGDLPEIEEVRIFDAAGRIRYSARADEIGRIVDKTSEHCVDCHLSDEFGGPRSSAETSRFFYAPDSADRVRHRVLGVIDPIRIDEDPSCVNCHSEDTVLGVLDIVVSLERLDEEVSASSFRMILFGGIGVAGIVAVVALLLYLLVHRPVDTLVEGTKEVARLRLDTRLPADRTDELGTLAGAFNEMTSRLQEAEAEILGFTENLERKVVEKTSELEAAQLRIHRAEKLAAIGRMASGAAHEINNPLAGLIAFAELLKRKVGKAGVEEGDMDTIIGEGMRCATVVRSLLEFARHGEFVTEPVEVNGLLDRVLDRFEATVGLSRIDVERSYAPDLPHVALDVKRMEHALLKLVLNAFEAMEGEGSLTLTTRLEDGGEPTVRIDIKDSGPGIPPEIQDRVFDPFFTTREPGRGTGLGLSVAHGIVEAHGGRIDLESSPGEGATFSIRFPIPGGVA